MSLNAKEGPGGLWEEVAGGKRNRGIQETKDFLQLFKILVCLLCWMYCFF